MRHRKCAGPTVDIKENENCAEKVNVEDSKYHERRMLTRKLISKKPNLCILKISSIKSFETESKGKTRQTVRFRHSLGSDILGTMFDLFGYSCDGWRS